MDEGAELAAGGAFLRGARRRPPAFNPFIVLSDVTISTAMVLACLLMVFLTAAGPGAREVSRLSQANRDLQGQVSRLEEKLHRRFEAILSKQRRLKDLMAGAARQRMGLPPEFGLAPAVGDTTFLFRFHDQKMFEPSEEQRQLSQVFGLAPGPPRELSPRGRRALQAWGRHFGAELTRQVAAGRGASGEPEVGTVIEIQIRGHVSPQRPPDPVKEREASVARAQAAAALFEGLNRELPPDGKLPLPVFSVAGMGAYRPAYRATRGQLDVERRSSPDLAGLGELALLERLRGRGVTKAALLDRLDILVLYSGGESQNNYVQAVDPATGEGLGPRNDTSDPNLLESALQIPPAEGGR